MRRSPRKPAPTVGVLFTLALLVATGCGSSGPAVASGPVATVGGTPIDGSQILADLQAEAAVPAKDKTGYAGSPLLDPDPRKAGVFTPAAKAEALSNRILYDIYGQELARLHITVTDADRESVRSAMCSDPTTGDVPEPPSCPALALYPEAYRDFLLDTQARVVALGTVIYGRVFDEVVKSKPSTFVETCVNLVQVANPTVADSIRAALAQGSTLAKASAASAAAGTATPSTQQCQFAAALPAQVPKAAIGAGLTIKSGSDLYVLQVSSRRQATKAEFQSDPPLSDSTVGADVSAQVHSIVRQARVTVDAAYGRWSAAKLSVLPPGASTASGASIPGLGPTTTTTAP